MGNGIAPSNLFVSLRVDHLHFLFQTFIDFLLARQTRYGFVIEAVVLLAVLIELMFIGCIPTPNSTAARYSKQHSVPFRIGLF